MNIILNGKRTQTHCTRLHDIQKEYHADKENIVVIVNGFQTSEDLPIAEGDEVTLIQKGKMPDEDVLEAMMRARHTPHVHEKVKKARVAIAGLGGLGSTIAVALARTGVGHLHLIDFDIVEPSNLNRQQYGIRHLGMYKTEALQQVLEEMNPYIHISTDTLRITQENAQELLKEDHIICEAFDNPQGKAMLVSTILSCCPDKKVVSASGMAGYESSNTITTKKPMKNLYLCGDGQTGAMVGRGLMAPRVLICAGHQANMILRLILGEEEV